MGERVHIEGLSDLQASLRELPDATAKAVLRRVARKRLQPVVDHAKRLVPVDAGDLRESLTVSSRLTRRQRRAYAKEGAHDIEMFAGAGPHPQAHMQEFGTSKDPAQPYLRPAWDAERHGILDGLKEDLWNEIKRTAARRARRAAKLAAST